MYTDARQARWAYVLLLPSILFLGVFFLWPMFSSILIALTDESGTLSLKYIHQMVRDVHFLPSLYYTTLLIALVVPIQTVLALSKALVLQIPHRGRDVFLWIWAIPLGISDLAAGVAWLSIFTERGYLNTILMQFGILDAPFTWLGYQNPVTLFLVVALGEIWRSTSIVMVILVSGLQVVNKEWLDAADVFGATPLQKLRRITIPLLLPSLRVALVLRTVSALQVFALAQVLTGRNLPVLAGEAYSWYRMYTNVGVAGAYSLLITVLSIGFATAYMLLLRGRHESI